MITSSASSFALLASSYTTSHRLAIHYFRDFDPAILQSQARRNYNRRDLDSIRPPHNIKIISQICFDIKTMPSETPSFPPPGYAPNSGHPAAGKTPTKYSIIKEDWGDRPNFQLCHGLSMSPEDIEEGNRILHVLLQDRLKDRLSYA
jgi:hypothetical protein